MSSTNVGSIHYDLGLDTSKFDTAMGGLRGSFQKATTGSTILLGTLTAIGVAVGVMAAKFVLLPGIDRALNIEDAQAKLRGLGHDANSVTKIMESALSSVKGTAYGLDAAATAAASAVAAGIAPGQDLTRVLKLTGDTATITGRTFNEAGAIINKVLASNRLSMEEVNQLMDAGLPILSMLGKEYGKTAGEMREMVSNGEVDSARFLNAIEKNIGGAALASGETTRGAWANMQAAMARVGAAIVKDIIPKVRDAFVSITEWFDRNSDKIVSAVSTAVDAIGKLAGFIGTALGWLPTDGVIFILAGAIVGALVPAFVALGTAIWTALAPLLPFIAAGAAIGAIGYLIYKNYDKIRPVVDKVVDAFKKFWAEIKPIRDFVGGQLKAAWDNFVSAMKSLWEVIQPIMPQLKILGAILLVSIMTPILVVIGLIVAFIAVITGIIWAVRTVWRAIEEAWAAIKEATTNAWQSVYNAVSGAIQAVWNFISPILEFIKNIFIIVWGSIAIVILTAWNWIYDTIVTKLIAVWNFISNTWNSIYETISGVVQRIIDFFAPAWNWLYEKGRAVVQGLIDGVRNMAGGVWSAIKGVADQIGAFFSGAWNWLYGVGRAIVEGLINGIVSMAGGLARKVEEIANSVKNKFSEALRIKSPSKVFYGFGQNIVQGLAAGIKSVSDLPQATLQANVTQDLVGGGGSQQQSMQPGGTTIYGDVNIGDKPTADYWFERTNRNGDLLGLGMAPVREQA